MEKSFVIAGVVLALQLAAHGAAQAQATRACLVNGKKVYTQFAQECADAAQTEINKTGGSRAVERNLTAVERDQAERARAAAEHAKQEEARARRQESQLLKRYPDAATHNKARALALEDTQRVITASEERLRLLAVDRKRLNDEAEFYVKRPMPVALKAQIESNDAAVAGQRAALQQQQAELARVNASYDAELAQLKRLWAQNAG